VLMNVSTSVTPALSEDKMIAPIHLQRRRVPLFPDRTKVVTTPTTETGQQGDAYHPEYRFRHRHHNRGED
jgi:hypothetical protein